MTIAAPFDLLLRGTHIVLPDGIRAATIGVRDGRIAAIEPLDWDAPARGRVDAGDHTVLPGLVDTHVHVNDPGTDWEGFRTAGDAAAAGGITTIIDMPLNSLPVTTTVAALHAKRRSAAGICAVDYGFWGGLVPGNLAELAPLLEHGVAGFKCFLCPSGLDAFPHVGAVELAAAMPLIAERGTVLLAHAEDPAILARANEAAAASSPRSYRAYLASRPPGAEVEAIQMLAALAERTGCRVHVVHVACAEAAATVAAARERGVLISAETCPHYLTFVAEGINDGATAYKCAPPVRGARHREALWRALGDGALDMVASDHSPCPPAMKDLAIGDFVAAWGGIASLQLSLPAVWSGARERGRSLQEVARWMGAAPAQLAGLSGRKGSIRVGLDADFVMFDPDSPLVVDPATLFHRHAVTPYAGMQLHGVVQRTYLRGRLVYDRPRIVEATCGNEVLRS